MNAVDLLFAWCRMPDVADPRVYLAGAAAIFDEYPSQVGQQLADPRTGTKLLKPYPSLFDIREACDRAYEPLERDIERQHAADSHRLGLAAPAKPDDQRREDQVEDYEKRIKPVLVAAFQTIPAGRVERRPDGRHFERVKADLEARRARNEQRQREQSADPPKESSAA